MSRRIGNNYTGARWPYARRAPAITKPGLREYAAILCAGHRGHWAADGSGDWHCSIHRQAGCVCIVWPDEGSDEG